MCLVSSEDDLALLPALVRAGVDAFQVRDKGLGTRDLVTLTREVVAAGVTVVVNDRLDVALAAGAAGVHLGAVDLAVADARRIAPDLLIGATCRDRSGVEQAARDGADYAGVGPVFATSSKVGLPAPLGLDSLAPVIGVLPVLAIGGITAERAGSVSATGVHGIAVIGGIWAAPDPVGSAAAFAGAIG